MKNIKIARHILIITIFIFASCQSNDDDIESIYLHIPDNHFEMELIELGIDSDGIINQQMSKADAKKVSVLDLNHSANFGEIEDLTGIEGFVNLTLLSAGGQNLEHIDLSHNTQLDTLYITGNKISNIDLSNNKKLIFVDLQSNDFSSINSISGLSNATNLRDLDLSWNYLEEFSIHNESLEVLHMSHNDLKTINTNGAISLRNIFMPSNKLETVDFSTNVSLETLVISDNKLQQIDIENNIELTHLYISSNSLAGIDVSNNRELVDLRVDRNPNLTCIKIKNGQYIPIVSLSDYQELNNNCN